jgi:ribosomal protein S10
VLDQSTSEIVETASAHGRTAAGRSAADREEQVDGAPFAARGQKSREQFRIRTQRLIDISSRRPRPSTP